MWLDSWRDGTVFILQTKRRKFRDVKQCVRSHTDLFFFNVLFYLFFFKKLKHLFLAVLDLQWAFSSSSEWGGLLFTAAPGLLIAVAFLVAEAVL